jgi:hypothetical protein
MAKKKIFVLVDEQNPRKMCLHIAFDGNDNPDQILCVLSERSVYELVKNQDNLPGDLEIDGDVVDYIQKEYSI